MKNNSKVAMDFIRNSLSKLIRYETNIRGIEHIIEYGGDFYKEIIENYDGFNKLVDEAYEGKEHCPKNLSEKMPNITEIWNLPFNHGGFMYGSSLGHTHPPAKFDIQEIYEFWNYGGMLICSGKKTELFVCEPGDKVAVRSNCMMSIFNFSYNNLITLDMANPKENKSSKNILKEKNGPMMALYHQEENCRYTGGLDFNLFKRFSDKKGIEKLSIPRDGTVIIKFNPKYEQLKDSRSLRLRSGNKDCDLCYEILNKKQEFEKRGIEVKKAASNIVCKGKDGKNYFLNDTLIQLLDRKDEPLHKLLGLS